VSELALRPAHAGDREFLFALMRDALGPHVIATFGPWDEAAQRERFFAALTRSLSLHQIVELGGAPIGCLNVVRSAEQLKLNRVLLLPSHQGRGLGSQLMRTLLRDADASRLPIRLRVLRVNPARRLYERLGFVVTGEIETHFLMERAARAREVSAR
jgi:ribosomal protein S18 acetylase RimI-like enzyme